MAAVLPDALDVDGVLALASAATAADGVAPFSDQTHLSLTRPTHPVTHLALARDDVVVGYAQLDAGSAELAVHPEHRRRGHGAALLAEVLATDAGARVWAHGPHAGAAPLAARAGLEVVRELWLMAAPLENGHGATAPDPPDSVRLTTFDAARDADDWVAVNARAFADHPEQGRLTRADLDARMVEPWFDPRWFWVARDERDGGMLGSLWGKVTDDVGEIYAVGIDPGARGRRLGGFLVATARAAFAAGGLRRIELYVEHDNVPAIAAYRRVGLERERADVQYAAQ
jgi:mycothiol synthase